MAHAWHQARRGLRCNSPEFLRAIHSAKLQLISKGAKQMPMTAAQIAPSTIPIAKLFDGFNTFSGSGTTMQAATGTAQSGGAASQSSYTLCTDYDSLQKALN